MPERPPPARTATADVTPVVEPVDTSSRRLVRERTNEIGAAGRKAAPVVEPWRAADFSTVPARAAASPTPKLLDRLVRTLPATGGAPLSERVATVLERATGMQPPAATRVHTGPASARAARALDARAFTTPDGAIHVGATPADDRLLLHEATHALQQRTGAGPPRHVSGPGDRLEANARDVATAAAGGRSASVLAGAFGVVHRDVVSDIKDKLSYGLFDWAITDAEASEAFALLDTVPDADLPGVLTKLGSTAVSRLLDNLPGELKTGPRYTRIVQALGPDATLPFVLDQLQTGLFDWAVTDAEVNHVFNVYANLTPAQQDQFWTLLSSRGRLAKLMSNVSESHEILFVRPWVRTLIKGATAEEPNPNAVNLTDPQKTVLRTMVEETSSLTTADLLLEARFNVTIDRLSATKETKKGDDKRIGTDFSLDQLRRLWVILEGLPLGHIAGNPELDRLTRYEGDPGSGVYFGDLDEAAVGEGGTGARFSDVVRHEVGHGVDAKIGFRSRGEHRNAKRGGWKDYGSVADAAKDAVTLSGAGISTLAAADRSAIEAEMVKVMNDNSKGLPDLKKAITDLPNWAALPEAGRNATRDAALKDKALVAVVANRKKNTPWYREDGGVRLGAEGSARVLQESYTGTWTSYDFAARKRAVSEYQFRAPGEWFAEAYVSYYAGGDTELGNLSVKDPDTKAWFDTNVHTK